VPVERLAEHPRCGACKNALSYPNEPLELSDADLEGVVAGSPLPVVVDFWAPWCAPCRMIGPVLEKLAGELSGQVIVAKINVDHNPHMAQRYDARAIPMLIGFAGGKQVNKQVGALSPSALKAWVQQVAAAR
jgi:thioredoxin 2